MSVDTELGRLQRVRVKICGVTRAEDACMIERAGADAIGMIFAERSSRRVDLDTAACLCAALGPFIVRVGVFVDAPFETVREAVRALQLTAVQLQGSEEPAYASALREHVQVIRAVAFTPSLSPTALAQYPADAILLDAARPGSGKAFDWSLAAAWRDHPRLVLAGGLTPESVASGIHALRPYAVDVASGVESEAGIKDPSKVQAFVSNARRR